MTNNSPPVDLKFSLPIHSALTSTANQGVLNAQELEFVIFRNRLQDLFQTQGSFHFDNCNFKGGSEYIGKQWKLIAESGDPKGKVALAAFARLLHGVQDFYSHSNWIELNVGTAPIPIWNLEVSTLPPQIVSGTWWLGCTKLCPAGAPTHDELHKDDPNSKEGKKIVPSGPNKGKSQFDLAFDAAVQASIVQFQRLAGLF